jgi:hypothetical protein
LILSNPTLFKSSDKLELGVFWLDDACSEIIHSKTVLEEDIDRTNPTKYSFQHNVEWEFRPKDVDGSYDDYPRGRIFYQDNRYQVEINVPLNPAIERVIRSYFTLPPDTVFKCGYW